MYNLIMNEIFEQYPDMIKMDGYDDCIIGVCHRINQPSILAYDRSKIIKVHMKDGLNQEESMAWFEFNQLGAWVGEHTPCFIETL